MAKQRILGQTRKMSPNSLANLRPVRKGDRLNPSGKKLNAGSILQSLHKLLDLDEARLIARSILDAAQDNTHEQWRWAIALIAAVNKETELQSALGSVSEQSDNLPATGVFSFRIGEKQVNE